MSGHVLVFGGSHSELPLIHAARRLGFRVTTSGNRPDHPGHQLADNYLPGDFSDPEAMRDVARRSGCDFIVSAANDYAYLSACEVAAAMNFTGFDHPDKAYTLHHKHLFKPLAATLGMPVTRFITIDRGPVDMARIRPLKFPLVVKPVDLTGGKGISVVSDEAELITAIDEARALSKSQALVIEEFFPGTLHSYSTIIHKGKVIFDYADNEFCSPSPYLVSTSTSQADVAPAILADLKAQTEKLAAALGLIDGILHCQFLHQDGDYVILEYTRRCSGDLYSDVVEAVTGVRHAEQFIRQSTGLPLALAKTSPVSEYVARHCVFARCAGVFAGINIHPELLLHVHSVTEALPHDHVFNAGWKEKAAVVLLRFSDKNTMEAMRPRFHDLLSCELTAISDSDAPRTPAEIAP